MERFAFHIFACHPIGQLLNHYLHLEKTLYHNKYTPSEKNDSKVELLREEFGESLFKCVLCLNWEAQSNTIGNRNDTVLSTKWVDHCAEIVQEYAQIKLQSSSSDPWTMVKFKVKIMLWKRVLHWV